MSEPSSQSGAEPETPSESPSLESPALPPSRGQVFLRRAGSTLTLWAGAVLAFVFPHPWVFGSIGAVLLGVGLAEYFRIAFSDDLTEGKTRGYRLTLWPTLVVSMAYLAMLFDWWSPAAPWLGVADLAGLGVALLVIILFTVRLGAAVEPQRTFREIAVGIFGFIYLAVMFGFVVKILVMPELVADGEPVGHLYVLFLFAITKFTDMGAYIVGSLIGRHKMIPHISPGKTWEGILGGVGFAALAALGLRALFPEALGLISWPAAAILAVVLAALAVVGDLAESILKRSLVVKDSGRVMPGIGGVLDLIDSVLFTAPVFYLYLRWVAG